MACDLPSTPASQNDSDNAVIEEVVLRLHLQIFKRRKKRDCSDELIILDLAGTKSCS